MVDAPAGMVTVVVAVPDSVAEKTFVVLVDDEVRVTVLPPVGARTGLLLASCIWTVNGPRDAVVDGAARVIAVEVIASFVAVVDRIVWAWVALVYPERLMVIVGVPALLSL